MATKPAAKKIEEKTTPDVREDTNVDDAKYFEKDYLVQHDGGVKTLTDEDKDRQVNDVRQSAIQRGLRPTGDVELTKTVEAIGHNVHLYYRVPVALAEDANELEVHANQADQHRAEDK